MGRVNPTHGEESLLDRLGPDLPPLVFILGAHRSGTTFLHQVLADTGHYNFVCPYDLIHFDRLLEFQASGSDDNERAKLDVELRASGPDRGLDACEVGANVAEEYGYILPKEGRFSFFSPSLTPANRPLFELLCRKKRAIDPAARPLILKNPDDFYTNFWQIHQWYPNARLIFLHRHPLAVLNSKVKAWLRALEKPNEYFRRLQPFYRYLLTQPKELEFFRQLLRSKAGASGQVEKLAEAYRYYLEHSPRLAKTQWMSLRYEDLCADPDHHLGAISQFLGQPAPALSVGSQINTRPLQLLDNVVAAYEAGSAGLQEYLSRFGYDARP